VNHSYWFGWVGLVRVNGIERAFCAKPTHLNLLSVLGNLVGLHKKNIVGSFFF